MRVATEIDKMTVLNGPGTKAMLNAVLELNRDRTMHGSNFESRTFLLFTVENPYSYDASKVRVRIDAISFHEDRGSLFPYILYGAIGSDLVEILYTPDRGAMIRGEVTDL